MKLLAFDTATEACTAALWLDGVVSERDEHRSQHSEHLLPMIHGLLADAGLTVRQLDAIAFGRGPGSFTGLRIGAGVAQGLAFAAGLPVVPVSSLAALAQGIEAGRILAALDARMQQVYWGTFERNAQGQVEACSAEVVCDPASVPKPSGNNWVGAGPGWDVYATQLAGHLGTQVERWVEGQFPRARHLATLAASLYSAGGAIPPENAIPVYLRDDVAAKSGPSR